jgi:hypothetical protein
VVYDDLSERVPPTWARATGWILRVISKDRLELGHNAMTAGPSIDRDAPPGFAMPAKPSRAWPMPSSPWTCVESLRTPAHT